MPVPSPWKFLPVPAWPEIRFGSVGGTRKVAEMSGDFNPNLPGRAASQAARLLEVLRHLEGEVAEGRPADAALTRFLRQHREMGSRDRRLVSTTAFACFRWRGWSGSVATEGPIAAVRAALLDGLQAAPDALVHLATGTDLAAALDAPPGFQGLDDRAAWVSKAWKPGARPADLVPAWAAESLAVAGDADRAVFTARWIEALQDRPPLWLRADGMTGGDLAAAVRRLGPTAVAHARLESAVRVDGHPALPDLERDTGAKFDVQDLASQVVGAVCAPQPGESWWDACAGAGGKTLDLRSRMANRGYLRATDVRPRALGEARRREDRLGRAGIDWRVHDAALPPPDARTFDGVLVDAPCSGLGTWSRAPDARWRTGPADVDRLAKTQGAILGNAAGAVRPGGTLVYAVCSLTRAETHGVVDAFLAERPDFAPAPVPHPLHGGPPAARLWVWPWDGPCIGMFVARLARVPAP
jgi:16S rRNA (cytosine967-C5)-methyltransferase